MATREDMTISRYGRGTCPACLRSIALTKAGTVGKHGDKKSFPPQDCAGYGREPKDERVWVEIDGQPPFTVEG